MTKENLEIVLDKKVKPMINEAMHKFLGVTIKEIDVDISDKLSKSPFLDFTADTSIPFKQAKHNFKRAYLQRLIQLHLGNVSKVAEIAGVDRRSVHRLIKSLGIDIEKHRMLLLKRDYVKQEAVKNIIENTLDSYKSALNPEKLSEMYKHVPDLSKDILKELPDVPITLKDAEKEFEKRYFQKALDEMGGNITKTAKKVGLRYETLHRKLKSLGVI